MTGAKLYRARYLLPIATAPLQDGAVLVEGGRITAVGRFAELRGNAAELVDFGDAVILPPLVNAHTHLELTHFPEWAVKAGEGKEPSSFVEWLLRIIRIKRGVAPDCFPPSLQDGLRLSLASGTGAVGDILSSLPARIAYLASPMRGMLYLETLGRDPVLNERALARITAILEEKSCGHMRLGLSPHSPYTLSQAYLEEIFDFARRREIAVSTHLAESPEETLFLRESGGALAEVLFKYVGWIDMIPTAAGRTPTAFLADRGGLGAWNLLVHGVQVTADDAALLARSGATVVLCPRSNARLGVGKAPIEFYRTAGVALALGTDSLASCDSLSIWDEMAFARTWFEGRLGPADLLDMATRQGARGLGMAGEMGTLEIGSGGHFQVLQPASLPPLEEIEEFLCTEGRTREVAALYLGGREVLQNGG